MKVFFDKKVLVSFFVALGLFAWLAFHSLRKNESFLAHTREIILMNQVLFTLEKAHSLTVDLETGQRGYLITGDSLFLSSYTHAIRKVDANLDSLQSLTTHYPDYHKRVAEMRRLIAEKNTFIRKAILARDSSFEAARDLVASYEGLQIMDEFKSIRDELEKQTVASLANMRREREKEMRAFNRTFAIVISTALVLLLLSFISIHYSLSMKAKTQRELLVASAEIRDLYDKAPCGYHSLNDDGVFVNINETELRWLGYTRTEVVGRMKFIDILADDDLPKFKANFEKFKKEGSIYNLEFRLRKKNGALMHVLLSASAQMDDNGKLLKTRSTLYDITERKRMETELQRVSEKLLDLYDNAPCGYFSVDEKGTVTTVNNTLAAWLLTTRENLVGKNVDEITAAASRDSIQKAVGVLERRGYIENAEVQLVKSNGRTLPVIGNASLEKADDGTVISIRCTVFDNTERKKAENKILQLNGELEAFTYSVSHDLRGPLRIMDGYARILKEDYYDKLDDEGKRVIGVIMENAGRMGELIDDLLQFARMGRKEVVMSTSDFKEMILQIAESCRTAEKGREIILNLGNLEPVSSDLSMMAHVWSNLMSNAVKYSSTKEHSIIDIGSYRNNGKVCFFIRDNGVGFNTDYKDKLFNVFQRLHRIDEFPGTGVGLALVKKIVTRHGGEVWAESKLDEGSTFYFSLPSTT